MPDSIFKPIFVAHDLEKAVLSTLSIWMPTYLQELELQNGLTRGLIPAPRTYTTRNEFTSYPEDQMPICVCVSPGLAGEPYAEGNGTYTGWWSIGIGVLASASTEEDTNFLAKLYAAAVRAIMAQQSSLGGVCSGIEWIDENYAPVPDEAQERTIRAAQWFGIAYIDDIVTRNTGPLEPADPIEQPGSLWPNITSGTILLNGATVARARVVVVGKASDAEFGVVSVVT